MSGENGSQVVFVSSRSILVRAGLTVSILLALGFGWYAFSREIGNMMAEVTPPTDPDAKVKANAAIWMAPGDPFVNWLLATTENDTFIPEKAAAAVSNFENVIRLAPYDYRWWIELGRAREQVDDVTGSEKALKRAVELAPNYAYPRWQLGNFYLRQGRENEAFAELKLAAQNNPLYREQVFYTVWDFYHGDKEQLEKIVGNSPQVQATLAKFYATHEQPEGAIRTWDTLTPEQKEENRPIGLLIMQVLHEKKNFRASNYFVRQMGWETEAEVGKIQNGGFESPMGSVAEKAIYFDWITADRDKFTARLDQSQKHEGRSSLRLNFNSVNAVAFANVSQIVALEPGARYTLTFWMKTENLKSAGPPFVEVAGINDPRSFGSTPPFPTGTNDWQQMRIDFTVPTDVDGAVVRTARLYCGDNCPLVGAVWYDEFDLQKNSGGK
jgi:tetratricopeptide (TPR) repeat protein